MTPPAHGKLGNWTHRSPAAVGSRVGEAHAMRGRGLAFRESSKRWRKANSVMERLIATPAHGPNSSIGSAPTSSWCQRRRDYLVSQTRVATNATMMSGEYLSA